MALATFDAATFGRPQFNGYAYQHGPRMRRLGVMDGAPRFRLTAPGNTISVNVSWVLNDQKLNQFNYWYENDIAQGSAWFLCDLMLGTGRTGNEPDSLTFRTYECHFVGEAQVQMVGVNWWQVTAVLELRPSAQYPIAAPDPFAARLSDYEDVTSEYTAGGQVLIYSAAAGEWRNRPLYSQVGGFLEAPNEIAIRLALDVPHPYEVVDLAMICASGSGVATALIGTTEIDGLDGVAFSSSLVVPAASSANDMIVGDDLVFRVDSVASAVDLWWRFKLRLAG